ncbi:MAG: FADH(2)-oxidizing methylenetetrahydrofolate--tRNA-(uracil(54)-C(5))-methyltransferase TrmFO [bacterium]
MEKLTIIGGGLAGCEAAWQAASRGIHVTLFEMRPAKMTPVHRGGGLAELVCSNSLGTDNPEKPPGILKSELRLLGSLILRCADESRVPAGQALAVDREAFSRAVEEKIASCPLITLRREEITRLPEDHPVIVAGGPMTSEALASGMRDFFGEDYLYFYDAVSPIVTLSSLDQSVIYRGSRYGRGEESYLNCPFNREEYLLFYRELLSAGVQPVKDFEKDLFFEACLPIEELARRGEDTMRFGPMKPVGLPEPASGREPYAVLQMRQENREGTLYNLVGFQTRLLWPEQERIFRLIPGLRNAEFVRLGVMHRNLYINAPVHLLPTGQAKMRPVLFLAGQVTGVEGYLESTASGWLAGINAARLIRGEELLVLHPAMAMGALFHHITGARPDHFQPMNVNFGIFPGLQEKIRSKQERNRRLIHRASEEVSLLCSALQP